MAVGSSIGHAIGGFFGGGSSQAAAQQDPALSQAQDYSASNPSGVQQVLQNWSQSMSSVLSAQTGVGGGLAARISGNTTLAATLQRQYTVLSKSIAQQQATMEAQWAKLEATMSTLKAQGTYLNQVSYTPSR